MKHLYFIMLGLLFAVSPSSLKAENLIVNMKSGEIVTFGLAGKPKITFEGATFFVKTVDENFSAELSGVSKFSFTSISGIDELGKNTERKTVKDGEIFLEGLQQGTQVMVADISGKILLRDNVGQDGSASINLNQLPSGVYIVKAGRINFKVANKR